MKYLDIFQTKSGHNISRTVLGTAGYGSKYTPAFCRELLDDYFSLGGNTLDTAAVYGESEHTLGQWLSVCNIPREDIIISTKGAHPPLSDMQKSRMTASDIAFDIENSFRELQIDYIDVYYLHRDDVNTPVGYIIDTLNAYVKAGRVRALGASNWTAARIDEANAYAAANGLTGFVFSQICHSLGSITPEGYGDRTLLTMNDTEYEGYKRNRVPIMSYTSQANGFFSKAFDLADGQLTGRWATPRNINRLHALRKLCSEREITPAQAVVAYLTSEAAEIVTLPIIAASSVGQLKESMSGCDVELSRDEIAALSV